jgi:hypothetical protein
VESSCKLGIEPSVSIKCWELPNGCTTCGLSSGTQCYNATFWQSSLCNSEHVKFNCCSAFWGQPSRIYFLLIRSSDRLCGLVARVTGCRPRGPGFDSRYKVFMSSTGSEMGFNQAREDK